MDRFVKRSMGNTESCPGGALRTAIDSASQRFVTVRQVFPDGPAPKGQASFRHFGGGPFPVRRLPGLAGAVLMDAAPLSERSNFEVSYHVLRDLSTAVGKNMEILSGFVHIGEAGGKNHCGLWQIRDMMLDKDSPADRAEMRGGEAMQTAELAVLDWIQAHLRCGLLDAVLPVISWTCDHGEIWIALAVILLLLKRQRWTGVSVSLGLILDLICCNLLLKPLVDRVRPFAVNTAVELLAAPPGDASFPSGHTAASFAAVFALRAAGSPLWKPALVLASLIAFSRLYLYMHWPTDVLGGIVLGAAVGTAGAWIAKQLRKRLGSDRS